MDERYNHDGLRFTESRSILKSSKDHGRTKMEFSHVYFKSRSNVKPNNKRGIFHNMEFKTHLQLSLLIPIQYVNEYGATETKTLAAISLIWRVITFVDKKFVILA